MRPSSASKLLASDNTTGLTASDVPLLLVGQRIGRGGGGVGSASWAPEVILNEANED